MNHHSRGLLSLSPILLFLVLYLVSSLVEGDFYKIPVSAPFLIASVYAIMLTGETGVEKRVAVFSSGAGNQGVLSMIWIFVLAGAFAATARDIGAVEATVNILLKIIPARMLFAGLFLVSCFISMAVGTSVGTIVALVPICHGIASTMNLDVPHITAVVVGGAFFGDNLSFISDTTIAATRAAGCSMREKFIANIRIVLPAVLVVTCIYLFQGNAINAPALTENSCFYKIIPYFLIIILALMGLDVMLILSVGIAVNAVIGLVDGSFDWTAFLSSVGGGIAGMAELIIVTMLAGGILSTVRHNGGLEYMINGLSCRVRGVRGAEFTMAALVSLANFCTANNTVAIITCSDMAREISARYGVDPRRMASILDTFSCFVQGILPYGAQLLMAAKLADISSGSIIPNLYYPFALGISALLAIAFSSRKYTNETKKC